MSRLDHTLANLAPGVTTSRDLAGRYNPRHGLAIYHIPVDGYSPSSPGMVLGEALAARSGLGCTLLEGIPSKVPEGAVIVGLHHDLKAQRPDLVEDIPEMRELGQYAIKLGRSAVVTSLSGEGLSAGMQTLSMIVLRHDEELLPGCLISDTPLCQGRSLALNLKSGEIAINLLMQIASFAATFKANQLHLILDDDFDPSRETPGIETFCQTCQSYGIELGVRLPLLRQVLAGNKTVRETWTAVRAAARVFGATRAAFDDPCPIHADEAACERIVRSAINGDIGLKHFSLDVLAIMKSGIDPALLKGSGVTGWYRMRDQAEPPSGEAAQFPLILDVQSPVPGFSGQTSESYHRRLDAAIKRIRRYARRELTISFRAVPVSHMWQNMMYPAATGLIAAWGNPVDGDAAAWRFSNLLYGDAARKVMEMWDTVARAFPPGMSEKEEGLVCRTAFGAWPEEEDDRRVLAGVDWLTVTRNIKLAAAALKSVAGDLTRNAATLVGARLSLYALSWLHCFVALTPELERRRRQKYDVDARTEPIAAELYNNFCAWHTHLQDVYGDSGLEFVEMPDVESMGLRLKGLCEGIFEYDEE